MYLVLSSGCSLSLGEQKTESSLQTHTCAQYASINVSRSNIICIWNIWPSRNKQGWDLTLCNVWFIEYSSLSECYLICQCQRHILVHVNLMDNKVFWIRLEKMDKTKIVCWNISKPYTNQFCLLLPSGHIDMNMQHKAGDCMFFTNGPFYTGTWSWKDAAKIIYLDWRGWRLSFIRSI